MYYNTTGQEVAAMFLTFAIRKKSALLQGLPLKSVCQNHDIETESLARKYEFANEKNSPKIAIALNQSKKLGKLNY